MTPSECARSDAKLQQALDLLAGLKRGAPTWTGDQVNK